MISPNPIESLEDALQAKLGAIKPAPNTLTFDAADSNVSAIASALMMSGIAIVRHFISASEITAARNALLPALIKDLAIVRREETKEYESYAVNFANQRFQKFPEMAAFSKPVFNMRNGATSTERDAGFIDLFKPDVLYPEALAALCAKLETGLPQHIVAQFAATPFRPISRHLYINQSITHTRDFHIDAEHAQIKVFLYLTDVTLLEDGPYCYIPGSHQDAHIKALNKTFNAISGRPATDMSLSDPALGIACLAPAGSLILSIQSGLHRGYPQAPGRQRLVLMQLFDYI